MSSFGSWFRAEREKAGLSLKELATSIGISQAYWSRIERGLELAPKDALIIAACERLGLSFLPYFPLANGLLTGKYRQGQPAPAGTRLAEPGRGELDPRKLETVERLQAFAADRGHTLLELAFAFLLARPRVASVIAGATKPEQVRANAAAAAWTLGPDDRRALDRLLAAS